MARPRAGSTSPDGLSLTVHLRPAGRVSRRHAGHGAGRRSAFCEKPSAGPWARRSRMSTRSSPSTTRRFEFRCDARRRSVIEALETTIQKPGEDGAGTGPFVPTSKPLGTDGEPRLLPRQAGDRPDPRRRRIRASAPRGPSCCAATSTCCTRSTLDALDSLQSSSNVVGVLVRPSLPVHDHLRLRVLPSSRADLRRELNAAIDRDAIVRDGLNGHGLPSSGPVPPRHWALSSDAPRFSFDAELADAICRAGTSRSRASSPPTRSTSAWR